MAATITSPSPGASAAEPPVMVALREIQKGVAATKDLLTFETNPDVLGDALCELAGLQCEIDSLRMGLVDQCSFNGVPQSIGVRTMGQYVAARTNQPAAAISIDAAMNKWLRDYPVFVEALASRDMSLAHLRYIKNHLASCRTFDAMRDDQQFLADTARDCSFAGFKKACDYWLIMVDPDGKEPKDQLEKSGLSFRGNKVEISLDTLTHNAVKTMIEHKVTEMQARPTNDTLPDTGPAGQSLTKQRLAAFLELLEKGFQRPDGTHPVPLFNFVMSPAVAEWATNQLANPNPSTDPVPVHPQHVDGRSELIDGTPIHPLLAVAMGGLWKLDTPTLRRYVMNADSRIIDYSYNARIAPEHLRTASHIEHRGVCSTPGCDAPHHWLQMDHIDPHSRGGQTNLRNTEPKCQADNQAKAATTGHTPWKDRPPPPTYQPTTNRHRNTNQSTTNHSTTNHSNTNQSNTDQSNTDRGNDDDPDPR